MDCSTNHWLELETYVVSRLRTWPHDKKEWDVARQGTTNQIPFLDTEFLRVIFSWEQPNSNSVSSIQRGSLGHICENQMWEGITRVSRQVWKRTWSLSGRSKASVGNPVKSASEVIWIFQQSPHLTPVFAQSLQVTRDGVTTRGSGYACRRGELTEKLGLGWHSTLSDTLSETTAKSPGISDPPYIYAYTRVALLAV